MHREKTCRLAYNTEAKVAYGDGSQVPRVAEAVYLGSIMSDRGYPAPEVGARINKAMIICKALKPLWASKALGKDLSIRVLRSCVFSALVYGLHTAYLAGGQNRRLDVAHIRCARWALGIRSTYWGEADRHIPSNQPRGSGHCWAQAA